MTTIRKIDDKEEENRMPLSESALVGVADKSVPVQSGKSGAFTNLSKYIEANKPQSQLMTSGILNKTEGQVGQYKKALQNISSQFTQKLQPEIARLGGATEQAKKIVAGAGQPISYEEWLQKFKPTPVVKTEPITPAGPSLMGIVRSSEVQTVEKKPSLQINPQAEYQEYLKQFAISPSDIDTKNILGLTPDQIKTFQDITNKQGLYKTIQTPELSKEMLKAKALENLAQSSKTSVGREQLLREMYSKPTYTKGQSALDNLLLQGDKNLRRQLVQGIADKTIGLAQGVEQEKSKAKSQLSDIAGMAEKAAGESKTLLTEAEQSLQKQLEEKQKNDLLVNLQKTIMERGALTPAQYEALKSLSGFTDTRTYGVNLGDYFKNLSSTYTEPSMSSVASNADYLRAVALAKLAGLNSSQILPSPTEVGSREEKIKNLLQTDFGEKLRAAKESYQRELAGLGNKYQEELDYYNQLKDKAASGDTQAFWNQFMSKTNFKPTTEATGGGPGYNSSMDRTVFKNPYTGEVIRTPEEALQYQQKITKNWQQGIAGIENKYAGSFQLINPDTNEIFNAGAISNIPPEVLQNWILNNIGQYKIPTSPNSGSGGSYGAYGPTAGQSLSSTMSNYGASVSANASGGQGDY